MSGAIGIERLSCVYPDGTRALDNVTLAVAEGERVALLGANGAGKSTLLLTLVDLLPFTGVVTVFGASLNRATRREARRQVGLVFQNPDDQLFSPTLYDDVAFGPRHAGLDEPDAAMRVERALRSVGLWDARSKSAFHLSFGQKKRAALATVLSMDARALALDEPTSGLDPRARRGMISLLASLPATLIVATHDFALAAALCPRAVALHEGRVAADGPTGAMVSDETLLKRLGLA